MFLVVGGYAVAGGMMTLGFVRHKVLRILRIVLLDFREDGARILYQTAQHSLEASPAMRLHSHSRCGRSGCAKVPGTLYPTVCSRMPPAAGAMALST